MSDHGQAMRPARCRRSAGVIMMAVVCLSLVSLLSLGVMKIVLQLRQIQTSGIHRLQAECLAESAVDRARARLAVDAGYQGETWTLTAAEMALPESVGEAPMASVEIVIQKVEGSPTQRRIRTRAQYPLDDPQSISAARDLGPFEVLAK